MSTGATCVLFAAGDSVERLAQLIWGSTITVVVSTKAAAATISHRFRVFSFRVFILGLLICLSSIEYLVVGVGTVGEYNTADFSWEAKSLSATAIQKAANHLRQHERGLRERARGESPGHAAKQPAGFRRVLEPPNIGHKRYPIHMDMLAVDEFHQTRAAVRPAKAALLDSAPRRLRNGVRVENFVDCNRAGVDALGQTLSARDVAGPDARSQTIDAVIRQPHRFVISLERHNGKHRTEGFFAHHIHILIDVGQRRRFKE